jgi:hypothetical protein
MSQALQSAQQSLQQAGQQSAQNGGGKKQDQEESSDSEMGQEFGSKSGGSPGQKSGSQSSSSSQQMSQGGSPNGNRSNNRGKGGGMGNPGQGQGGNVGPQQPLPGPKKDELVKGTLDPHGKKLSRSYMGTPDPTHDRAAYYQIVPDRARAAEASLNSEEIPVGQKDQVKRYFQSIQGEAPSKN